MSKRRRCFNRSEKLAAAYLALGLVPEPLASTGSAEEIIRQVEGDHNVLHCLGGDTRPQNCNLLPRLAHREKSRRDIAVAAKVKRIADQWAAFWRRMDAKKSGERLRLSARTAKGNRPMPCGRHSGWRKPIGKWNAVRREK